MRAACAIALCLIALGLSVDASASATPGQAPPAAVATSAEARYHAGLDALAKQDWDAAARAFEDSARLDPDSHLPLLGLADAALARKRPEEAETWLRRAEARAPQAADVRTALGRLHFMRGDHRQAETAFRSAIALDAKAITPRLDLANLYLKGLRDPAEAARAYRAALELEPQHAGAQYGLGLALSLAGERAAAMRALERAVQLAPANPLPAWTLGGLYAGQKDYDRALAAFDLALAIQPSTALRMDRARVLEARKEIDRAIGEYELVTRSEPNLAEPHGRLGSLYQHQRRLGQAETAYRKALQLDPENPVLYNNLAWMAADRGVQLDEALAWAQRAVQLAPAVLTYKDTLAWVHRARGELDKSVEILMKAVETGPPSAEIYYHLGIVFAQQQRKEHAAIAFTNALGIDGNFAHAEDARRRLAALGVR